MNNSPATDGLRGRRPRIARVAATLAIGVATVVIGNVDTASAVTGKASIDAVERSRPQVPGTQVSDVAGGRLTYR